MIVFGYVLVLVAVIVNGFAFIGIKDLGEEDDNISVRGRMIMMTFIIIIQSYFLYNAFFKYPTSLETYTEKVACKDLYYEKCGKVIDKKEGIERHGKHHNEYYMEWLIIKFDNGITERTEVSRNTYSKYSIGESICFVKETDYMSIRIIILVFTGVCSLIGLIIALLYANKETDY